MNGAHDMGGVGGYGPVRPEANEPVFYARWEARIYALTSLLDGGWTIDEDRHTGENLAPQDYLKAQYYERWLMMMEKMTDKYGIGHTPSKSKPISPADVFSAVRTRNSYERAVPHAPLFAVGDKVRVRTMQPRGHTRLPGYLRGHQGLVVRHHGAHVFPDSNAHGQGENPQHLYVVKFNSGDLFGGNPRDSIHADMWEPYLERI